MLPLSVLQVSGNGPCCLCLFYRRQGMVQAAFDCFTDVKEWSLLHLSVLQVSRNGPCWLCLFYRRQGMSMLPLSVLQTSRNGPSCLCLFYKEAVFSASGLSQLKAHHKIGHEIPSPTWGKTRSRDVIRASYHF